MFRADSDPLPASPAQALAWAAEHLEDVRLLQTGELYRSGVPIVKSPTTMLGALDVVCGNGRIRSGVTYDWPVGAAVKRAALAALSDQLTRNGVMPLRADSDEDSQRRAHVARWEQTNAMDTGRAVLLLEAASESSAMPLYRPRVRRTGPAPDRMLLAAVEHLEKVGLWRDADGVHACDPTVLAVRSPATLLYAFDQGVAAYTPAPSDDHGEWERFRVAATTALAELARAAARREIGAVPPHLDGHTDLDGYRRLQVQKWSCGALSYPDAATDRACEVLRSAARHCAGAPAASVG